VNALTLYHDLKARGVLLEAGGERLLVDAPAGELTDEDRAALTEFKPLLLKFLSRIEPQDGGRRFRVRPSRYPGYTSLYDPVHNEWHDFPTRDCFPSIVAEAGTRRKGAQHETRTPPEPHPPRAGEDHKPPPGGEAYPAREMVPTG
jgi:hypothetical protein